MPRQLRTGPTALDMLLRSYRGKRKPPKHVLRLRKYVKKLKREGVINLHQILSRALLATDRRAMEAMLGETPDAETRKHRHSPNKMCKDFLAFMNAPIVEDRKIF